MNGSIYRITPNADIDPSYLAAILVSPIGTLQKKRAAANSVISYLSLDFLNALRIPRCGDDEATIADGIRTYVDHTYCARALVEGAKRDVETLIEGTLDESKLLAESAEIECWLASHPAP